MSTREADLKGIERAIKAFGKDVLVVRPGLSLFLYSDQPLIEFGSGVAQLIERYVETVPQGALDAYLGTKGYKSLTKRVLNQQFATLRSVPPEYEFLETYYKDGVDPSCGTYGVRLQASRLDDPDKPLETNLLAFDWPASAPGDASPLEQIIDLARMALRTVRVVSGNAGFTFLHPQTFPSEARRFIQSMMTRYLGFDPNYERSRYYMRDRAPSAHWANLLGEGLLKRIGGIEQLQRHLPRSVDISVLEGGAIIRATDQPPIGDANRGAADLGHVPDVAHALRSVRFEISGFGGEQVDAAAWLARFDKRGRSS